MSVDLFAHLPCTLERLCLRRLRMDDVARFHACRSDPQVARYQGWEPMTLVDAHVFVHTETVRLAWLPDTWCQLAIATRADDALVGDVGVWLSSDQSQVEFGISLERHAQGRGYGTETVRGLLALLFATTSATTVVASADARNNACLAMLERCGLQRIGSRQAVYKGELCTEHAYRITRAAAGDAVGRAWTRGP